MTLDLTVPFGATIEELRKAWPLVFEARDKLVAELREAEHSYSLFYRETMTDESLNRIQRKDRIRERWRRDEREQRGQRAELDRINKAIADVVMLSPRPSIVAYTAFGPIDVEPA